MIKYIVNDDLVKITNENASYGDDENEAISSKRLIVDSVAGTEKVEAWIEMKKNYNQNNNQTSLNNSICMIVVFQMSVNNSKRSILSIIERGLFYD